MHQPFDDAPAFGTRDELQAFVDREEQGSCFAIARQTVKEAADGNIQRAGDLVEHGSADAVARVFVFLELLKADSDRASQLRLRDIRLDAHRRDLSADMPVRRMGARFVFRCQTDLKTLQQGFTCS